MTPRKRGEAVPRPTKKTEYQLVFCSREAVKGWQDCLAAVRNAVVDWTVGGRVPVSEVEGLIRGPVDANPCHTREVEVSGQRDVSAVTEGDRDVGDPLVLVKCR